MAKEIEVKYLVSAYYPKDEFTTHKIVQQGYLCPDESHAVRVNLIAPFTESAEYNGLIAVDMDDVKSLINVKGARNMETRDEFEYKIPPVDALAMMNMLQKGVGKIMKIRSTNKETGWVIDRYLLSNQGLIIAEKEYASEAELRADEIPDWCIRNVTYDDRFYNRNLANTPFTTFPEYEELCRAMYGSEEYHSDVSQKLTPYSRIIDKVIEEITNVDTTRIINLNE